MISRADRFTNLKFQRSAFVNNVCVENLRVKAASSGSMGRWGLVSAEAWWAGRGKHCSEMLDL